MRPLLSLFLSTFLLIGLVNPHTNAANRWTDGQAAGSVLGQADFTSGLQNQGTAVAANTLRSPKGVAVDPTSGKVFVADTGNNRVLRYSSMAALQTNAAAEAVLGQPDMTTSGAALTPARMKQPGGVTVSPAGVLWVSDTNNNRVLRFDNASTILSGPNANGVLGQPAFTGNTPANSATGLQKPAGLFADANGRLWVADQFNGRVLRYDAAASKANGAAADGVLGAPDFTSSNTGTTDSLFGDVIALFVDAEDRLWVADRTNHRVLRFDAAATKSNGGAADGVLGQADFVSSTPALNAFTMRNPNGMTMDGTGTLWVSDNGNARVLRFDLASQKGDGSAADGVLGQPDLTTGGSTVSEVKFSSPGPLATQGDNRLWVVDSVASRVLRFEATVSPPRNTALISSLKRKIKKLKAKIRSANQKGQRTKANRLKKSLKRVIKRLRAL